MKVTNVKIKGKWREVADSARTTIGLDVGNKEVSSEWKRKMLLSEHSPIRQLIVKWKWIDIQYWVSVHITRHFIGIIHWVKTSRTDRTGINRDALLQGNLVNHEIEANAQAIINISRKRLCFQASTETRQAWIDGLNSIKELEPELYKCSVPDCIYRGHCFEYKSCGYHKTEEYKIKLTEYRENINS